MSQEDVDFTHKMADDNYVDFTQYNSSKTNSKKEKFKKQFQRLGSSSTKNEDDVKLRKSNEKRNSAKEIHPNECKVEDSENSEERNSIKDRFMKGLSQLFTKNPFAKSQPNESSVFGTALIDLCLNL